MDMPDGLRQLLTRFGIMKPPTEAEVRALLAKQAKETAESTQAQHLKVEKALHEAQGLLEGIVAVQCKAPANEHERIECQQMGFGQTDKEAPQPRKR